MTNLPVPVPATVAPGQLITGALFNAQVGNATSFLSNPPIFAGHSSVAQSTTNNTFVPLSMDTNRLDTYSGHSTTTNNSRYTAQVAGYYWVHAQVSWAANATGSRAIELAKNGATILGTEDIQNTSNLLGQTQHCFDIIQLNAGDYIEAWVYQNSGGALSTSSTGNWQPGMSVVWIHA